MNIIKALSFLLICTSLIACNTESKVVFKGVSLNEKAAKLYLISIDSGYVKLDSVDLTDGEFTLERHITKPTLFSLRTDVRSLYISTIFVEPGKEYQVEVQVKKIELTAPENSLQAQFDSLQLALAPFDVEMRNLTNKTGLSKEELGSQSTEIYSRKLSEKSRFIKAHPTSLISLQLLHENFRMGGLRFQEFEKGFMTLDSSALGVYSYYQNLKKEYLTQKDLRLVGLPAPNFNLKNPEGTSFQLSDFSGNYVLLDFWASWCAPCRVANRQTIPLYEKYAKEGFQVVSISLDDKRDLWEAAIEKDGIPWVNISDLKGFDNSEIRMSYRVERMPTVLMIDPEGTIVGQGLSHDELEAFLQKIYPNG